MSFASQGWSKTTACAHTQTNLIKLTNSRMGHRRRWTRSTARTARVWWRSSAAARRPRRLPRSQPPRQHLRLHRQGARGSLHMGHHRGSCWRRPATGAPRPRPAQRVRAEASPRGGAVSLGHAARAQSAGGSSWRQWTTCSPRRCRQGPTATKGASRSRSSAPPTARAAPVTLAHAARRCSVLSREAPEALLGLRNSLAVFMAGQHGWEGVRHEREHTEARRNSRRRRRRRCCCCCCNSNSSSRRAVAADARARGPRARAK